MLNGAVDLNLTRLYFDFIGFNSILIFFADYTEVLFRNFNKMQKPHIARLPTFIANILKLLLSFKRNSSEDEIKIRVGFISFTFNTLDINEKPLQEKEKS